MLNRRAIARRLVASLTAIALVAPLDAALARGGSSSGPHGNSAPTQSHIAVLPVKQPIGHPIVVNGPKPVLGLKRESKRERRELRKLERCIEYGRCRGVVIRPIGSPKPLPPQPVGLPIGGPKPLPPGPGMGSGSGGTATGTNGGYPIGSGTGTPVNAPPTKPPVLTDPGYGAPSKSGGSGGGSGGGGSASPIDNGGTTIKQF